MKPRVTDIVKVSVVEDENERLDILVDADYWPSFESHLKAYNVKYHQPTSAIDYTNKGPAVFHLIAHGTMEDAKKWMDSWVISSI